MLGKAWCFWESELKYSTCRKYPLISKLIYWMIINNVNVIKWKCSFPVKEVIQFLIIISLKWANTAISSRYQFIHYHKVSHLFHQTWGIRKLLLYCYFCMWIAHIVALLKKLYLQLAPLKLHLVHQSPKMKVCWIQLKSVPEKCSVHYIFISRKQFFRS